MESTKITISESELQEVISNASKLFVDLAPKSEYHNIWCTIQAFSQLLGKKQVIELNITYEGKKWK